MILTCVNCAGERYEEDRGQRRSGGPMTVEPGGHQGRNHDDSSPHPKQAGQHSGRYPDPNQDPSRCRLRGFRFFNHAAWSSAFEPIEKPCHQLTEGTQVVSALLHDHRGYCHPAEQGPGPGIALD